MGYPLFFDLITKQDYYGLLNTLKHHQDYHGLLWIIMDYPFKHHQDYHGLLNPISWRFINGITLGQASALPAPAFFSSVRRSSLRHLRFGPSKKGFVKALTGCEVSRCWSWSRSKLISTYYIYII
jgi:hypothetical protein